MFTITPATWAIVLGSGLLIWALAGYGLYQIIKGA